MANAKVVMKYGYSGRANASSLPRLIQSGTLEYESTIENTDFSLEAGSVYVLVTSSTTKATDAYSGHATYQWEVPTGAKYGNTAGHSAAMVTQGTQRVSITANADSTFTIKPTGLAYRVKYALYKVV